MVDEEVENTLREIRERVRRAADLEVGAPTSPGSSAINTALTSRDESPATNPEITARIDAYLTTTGRAWDRLPPVVSNRSGGLARLELWLKRHLKRATRWYSWEQINFNAAVHHALRDTLDALLDLEQQVMNLRAQITSRAQQNQLEMIGQRAEIESLRAGLDRQRADLESQRVEIEAQRSQMESDQRGRDLEMNARLADMAREFGDRDQQDLQEQRVCYKQLSLEISEAEVLLDRARRDIESRLDKLEGKSES